MRPSDRATSARAERIIAPYDPSCQAQFLNVCVRVADGGVCERPGRTPSCELIRLQHAAAVGVDSPPRLDTRLSSRSLERTRRAKDSCVEAWRTTGVPG